MRGVTFCGEIDTPADLDADGSGSTSRSVRVCPAVERRQCFDLPPAAVEVTEHQLVERECGCGQRTKGTASDGVDAPVQYGPRIETADPSALRNARSDGEADGRNY